MFADIRHAGGWLLVQVNIYFNYFHTVTRLILLNASHSRRNILTGRVSAMSPSPMYANGPYESADVSYEKLGSANRLGGSQHLRNISSSLFCRSNLSSAAAARQVEEQNINASNSVLY